MRHRTLAGAIAALGLLAAPGCGISGDGELQTIRDEDLQGLDETTTSTTATTAPATTTPAATTPPGATSTTIGTEPVDLYFVDGNLLQPVRISLAAPVSPTRAIAALLTGPPSGEAGIGLRTHLRPGLVNFPVVESGAGYASVDLETDAFSGIDPADQRTAIAQIVLTLVSRPGIGQVQFTLDGEPMRVPRRDGLQSDPGDAVYKDDYVSLLDPAVVTSTTSGTTSTAPTTTVSPPEEPSIVPDDATPPT